MKTRLLLVTNLVSPYMNKPGFQTLPFGKHLLYPQGLNPLGAHKNLWAQIHEDESRFVFLFSTRTTRSPAFAFRPNRRPKARAVGENPWPGGRLLGDQGAGGGLHGAAALERRPGRRRVGSSGLMQKDGHGLPAWKHLEWLHLGSKPLLPWSNER